MSFFDPNLLKAIEEAVKTVNDIRDDTKQFAGLVGTLHVSHDEAGTGANPITLNLRDGAFSNHARIARESHLEDLRKTMRAVLSALETLLPGHHLCYQYQIGALKHSLLIDGLQLIRCGWRYWPKHLQVVCNAYGKDGAGQPWLLDHLNLAGEKNYTKDHIVHAPDLPQAILRFALAKTSQTARGKGTLEPIEIYAGARLSEEQQTEIQPALIDPDRLRLAWTRLEEDLDRDWPFPSRPIIELYCAPRTEDRYESQDIHHALITDEDRAEIDKEVADVRAALQRFAAEVRQIAPNTSFGISWIWNGTGKGTPEIHVTVGTRRPRSLHDMAAHLMESEERASNPLRLYASVDHFKIDLVQARSADTVAGKLKIDTSKVRLVEPLPLKAFPPALEAARRLWSERHEPTPAMA